MKILQINAVNRIGSTGRTSFEMAEHLNKTGHEAYIAHSSGPEYAKGFLVGGRADRKTHALLSRLTGLQGYFSKSATGKLLNYMDKLKPEIVHLRNLHGNFLNLPLLFQYLAERDIPTVLTLHDCWFFTGKCSHYTEAGCRRWQDACSECPALGEDIPSWFFDRTGKMYEDKKRWVGNIPRLAVAGVSDWITGEAEKSFLASAKILKRIYNWIDMDVFRPVDASEMRKKLGLEGKFVIVGAASRWSERKGLGKFMELAKIIPPECAVVLAGKTPRPAEPAPGILWAGETQDSAELAGYYSMADVFYNPSAEETFGKVAAEALSCGTPVVTNDSTANPELVPEGTGYVLEENTAEAALEAVLKVKEKGKRSYSGACSAFAKISFDKKRRIEDYLKLYGEISR